MNADFWRSRRRGGPERHLSRPPMLRVRRGRGGHGIARTSPPVDSKSKGDRARCQFVEKRAAAPRLPPLTWNPWLSRAGFERKACTLARRKERSCKIRTGSPRTRPTDHGRTDLPERSGPRQGLAGVSERTWHHSGRLRSHRPPAPVWSNSWKSILPRRARCATLKKGRSSAMPGRRNVETHSLGPALARRPASEFELSAAEKKLLKDRDWIDEEEADLILAIREEKEHGLRGENIRDFARRHGRDVKD